MLEKYEFALTPNEYVNIDVFNTYITDYENNSLSYEMERYYTSD